MGTVLNEELVKSIDIETADEFLHAISPLGKVFDRNYLPGGWLYRGHSDSRWPLLPTALRSSTVLKLREWTTVEETVRAQVHEEVRLLREFFNTADRSGLPLPEDSQHLRTELADWINDSTLSDTLRRRNLPWPP